MNTPKHTRALFRGDKLAWMGAAGVLFLLLMALLAPLLANGRPWILIPQEGAWRFPAVSVFFAPDTSESLIEKTFNYLLLFLPLFLLFRRIFPRKRKWVGWTLAVLLLIPFLCATRKLDKTDYRALPARAALFSPIPYSPYEAVARPYAPPDARHWLGCDEIGRDLASRMLYGARVSLAVGIGATLITVLIGTLIGMLAGYLRGWFDLLTMRGVEMVMCFPSFLLLLIIMSILHDYKFEQSILIVIGVIGLTGWIGLTFLVRGEVLKQCALPYVQSCEVAGLPLWRILLFHLLPNISGPILIAASFGVAGAILAESGLSFLGFGVRAPTASWGALLRQAVENPVSYWHLTFFPGLALFIAVAAFNFTGEGLRKMLSPRE